MDKKHRKEAGEGVEEVKRSLSMKVSDTCLRPSLSGSLMRGFKLNDR